MAANVVSPLPSPCWGLTELSEIPQLDLRPRGATWRRGKERKGKEGRRKNRKKRDGMTGENISSEINIWLLT